MLSGEAASVLFDQTWVQPTIYRTQDKHANHCTIDTVMHLLKDEHKVTFTSHDV